MKITISASAVHDFARITKLGSDTIAAITNDLSSASSSKALLTRNSFVDLLGERLDTADASRFAHHTLSMATGRQARSTSAIEFIDALTPEVGDHDWTQADNDAWQSIKADLASLIESDALTCLQKSLELAYEYDNLLTGSRIITDIRPIFDGDHTEIVGSVVTHTLRLQYHSEGEEFEMGLAVDSSDIRELMDACRDATKKADIAKKLMIKKANIDTIIVGEGE